MFESRERNWDFESILVATVVCSLMYLIQGMYASAWGAQAGFILGVVGCWAKVPRWTDNSWDWYQYEESEEDFKSKAA